MAQFFKEKPTRSVAKSQKLSLSIQSLDHLAQGVAQHQGKVVFVDGALPGENVQTQLTENKKQFAKAKLLRIDTPSEQRIAPACPHYQRCGGCNLQHLDHQQQAAHKRQALKALFSKLAQLTPAQQEALPEIDEILSAPWGYRRKARLSSWYDRQQKQFTLGFRGRESHKVVGIDACPVLAPELSGLIKPVAACLARLQSVATIGHVELIATAQLPMVVIRVTQSLSAKDEAKLIELAERQNCAMVLEHADEQWQYLRGERPSYQLQTTAAPLSLRFNPGNFIQVNAGVNQHMVARAVEWLAVSPTDKVLDLFCGMGNFSLAIAAGGAEVTGVEGVANLVELAKANADAAGLANATFYCSDLNGDLTREPWFGKIDKLLLDPSRAGAFEALAHLGKLSPERVVYVSCNPVSLARDSQQLFKLGYQLTQLTALDMFPQTHHIEAMALFVRHK
ncbi:23S rRNA (uracil(1939)-C(5))-methyltransferase RlmD [Shewanella avicenniae]|uniref:23S rRNA (uracil(1939)-C(5))-methyltransferase RlmD n=1 Tax=Shewanella avicenniae TaxID=2814294 RepID=A0ABX7QUQ4_9GAMM|nr:23S rRNA (uracil(1939)-C(5))-methyltransferase RlmD [Shewanella avicenniae]QSX34762.1 23S rRNA (uracil(1939)-C(5))-methyltransferase RlmD [Shewanella avicenniae]